MNKAKEPWIPEIIAVAQVATPGWQWKQLTSHMWQVELGTDNTVQIFVDVHGDLLRAPARFGSRRREIMMPADLLSELRAATTRQIESAHV